MRSAPSVHMPVGRFVWGRYMAAVLAALSMGGLFWTVLGSGSSRVQDVAALLAWVCAAVLSGRLLGSEMLPLGDLTWDGSVWRHVPRDGAAVPVEVVVVLDVQVAMLVRVKAEQAHWKRVRYAWLHAVDAPALWHVCRCAVFGRDIL